VSGATFLLWSNCYEWLELVAVGCFSRFVGQNSQHRVDKCQESDSNQEFQNVILKLRKGESRFKRLDFQASCVPLFAFGFFRSRYFFLGNLFDWLVAKDSRGFASWFKRSLLLGAFVRHEAHLAFWVVMHGVVALVEWQSHIYPIPIFVVELCKE